MLSLMLTSLLMGVLLGFAILAVRGVVCIVKLFGAAVDEVRKGD